MNCKFLWGILESFEKRRKNITLCGWVPKKVIRIFERWNANFLRHYVTKEIFRSKCAVMNFS